MTIPSDAKILHFEDKAVDAGKVGLFAVFDLSNIFQLIRDFKFHGHECMLAVLARLPKFATFSP